MIANIELLIPEFRGIVIELLSKCEEKGVKMVPCETLRSPFLQASYWRQSRNDEKTIAAISRLKEQGADFLAYCVERAATKKGPKITNALPGYSWHQWGEAIDCFWEINGKAIWDMTILSNGVNGYEVYANEAKKLGLDAGFFWKSIKDAPHVQYQEYDSPADVYTIAEINEMMKDFYSAYKP